MSVVCVSRHRQLMDVGGGKGSAIYNNGGIPLRGLGMFVGGYGVEDAFACLHHKKRISSAICLDKQLDIIRTSSVISESRGRGMGFGEPSVVSFPRQTNGI